MNESNRPRHSLDSRYQDYDLDFDPQADELVEPYAAQTPRGLGKPSKEQQPKELQPESVDTEPAAAAAGAGAVAQDKHHSDEEIFGDAAEPADQDTNGLPMRGLVMILAAVGVLLVGWGAFTLLSGDDKGEENAAATSQPAEQNQEPAAAPNNPAPAEESAPAEEPAAEDNSADQAQPAQPADEAAAAPAIDPAKEYIAVLNNSPIQGLAGDVSNKIKEGEYKSTGFGNLPDATFPESVVVYPSDSDGARQAAEDLARQLGIRAEARTPEIDRAIDNAQMLEGAAPDQIVVITTNNMPR